MKKSNVIILLVIFLVGGLLIGRFNISKKGYNNNVSKGKNLKQENALSMFLEKTIGSGEYELTSSTSWPTDGYIFNATLSKCENGSKLSWNDEKKSISMTGNMSDKCYIYFDKYIYGVVNNLSYTATKTTLSITASSTKGMFDISKYYFSINDGDYIESIGNSYTFTGLTAGTAYNIKVKLIDSYNRESEVFSEIINTQNPSLVEHIISQYNGVQGNNNIYYHNGSLTNGISDGSYRYAGASADVNNYVCFGSTDATCPEDNLYRIIGVFDGQVKLIKSTIASSTLIGIDGDYANEANYYWNYKSDTTTNSGNGSNTWSTSLLNIINLNTNYINNIGSTWANKIAKTTWKIGGNTFANIGMSIPSTAYANEITNSVTDNTTDNATTYGPSDKSKIGLMYVTDYGFAAAPAAWTTTHYDYDSSSITAVNWLYIGVNEWTITRYSEGRFNVFGIDAKGYVSGNYSNRTYGIRPCFYLNAEVSYVKGEGSVSSPIIID